MFDKDNSGEITIKELDTVLRGLGHKFSNKNLKEMFQSVDTDGSGAIDFQEFVAMLEKQTYIPPHVELREAFDVFDQDGDGTIDMEELLDTMRSVGCDLTNDQLKAIMQSADTNNVCVVVCLFLC